MYIIKRFIIFFVVVFITPLLSATESTEIDLRLKALEKKSGANLFSYDLELKKDVARSITLQENLTEQLTRFDTRLANLEFQFINSLSNSTSHIKQNTIKVEYEKKIEELRKNLVTKLKMSLDTQNKMISTMKYANDKALGGAENFVTWLLYFFTFIISAAGVLITWRDIQSGKKIVTIDDKLKEAEESSKSSEESSKKALEYTHSIVELKNGSAQKIEKNVKEVKQLHKEMNALHQETISLHQVIDFRENYRRYIHEETKGKSILEELTKTAIDIIKFIQGFENSNSFNNSANISNIASLLGVIYFKRFMLHDAYNAFLLSKETNVKNLKDRDYNLACTSAQLYIQSNRESNLYFEQALKSYLEVMDDEEYLDILRGDPDFTELVEEIDKAISNK